MFDLSGRRALVTGASTGLGQAISLALACAGAQIVCSARSAMDETRARIVAKGGDCILMPCDLSKPRAASALVEDVWTHIGPLDILVNNAAAITRADATEMTEEQWDDVMDLNAKQVFFACQTFGQRVLGAGRRGKVINIASIMALHGGWRVASYTASKHAVAGITRILACEWAARGINVNAIAPGFFDTAMNSPLKTDNARFQASLARIPAGRWGLLDEIGGAAIYLASDASNYVHGILLPVDGGWLAR